MVDDRGEVSGAVQLYVFQGAVISLQYSVYALTERVGGVKVLQEKVYQVNQCTCR